MTDPYLDSAAVLRAEFRAGFAARDPHMTVAPSLLADQEPLESLIRKLQRKIEEAAGPRSIYGLPVARSSLVPPGEVWIVKDTDGELHRDEHGGYDYLRITRRAYYSPHDAAGYPSALERHFQAAPLYTRHTLGAREAARDWRRNRRPSRRWRASTR